MIADAHNDLLLELVLRADEPEPFRTHWLPQLRAGGVALQVCPLYTADLGDGARAGAQAQLDAFERALEECPDDVFAVRTRADLDRVGDGGIGLMLSVEGVEPLGSDPTAFAWLWDAGVRMVGLTWNRANAFAGGIESPGQGLTAAGRELVAELVRLGVPVDLAHASDETWAGVLETDARVLVSHAGVRAVHDHVRNLSDDQLRALAARDGLLGLMALALVCGPPATVERLVDHCDHAVGELGAERVCLGADVIDQVTAAQAARGATPEGMVEEALAAGGGHAGLADLAGPEDFPHLVAALRGRGYEGERLDGILHGNLLRFLRETLPDA